MKHTWLCLLILAGLGTPVLARPTQQIRGLNPQPDRPTASNRFISPGTIHSFNPQPDPPGKVLSSFQPTNPGVTSSLNPQPLPPRVSSSLNPQPLPPGAQWLPAVQRQR